MSVCFLQVPSQGTTSFIVFQSLWVPLGCDRFPDFSWFLMTLTGALVKYFVESPSVGDSLKLFSWGDLAVLMCLTLCFLPMSPQNPGPQMPLNCDAWNASALWGWINCLARRVPPEPEQCPSHSWCSKKKTIYSLTSMWVRVFNGLFVFMIPHHQCL